MAGVIGSKVGGGNNRSMIWMLVIVSIIAVVGIGIAFGIRDNWLGIAGRFGWEAQPAASQPQAEPKQNAAQPPATSLLADTAHQATDLSVRAAANLPAATPAPQVPAARSLAQRIEEQSLTRDEVNRLVTLLQNTYRSPTGHGVGGILLGRSDDTKYFVYFNGTAMGPPDRAIGIQLLPTHLSAHLPTSGTNREAFLVWDWGLDGTVNKGERGSPYAPTAEEDRYPFQSGISGRREIGLEHRATYQGLFANAVRDILARRR